MVLAIKFDGLVRRGQVRDYADLAALSYVTRARITQIMNLLNLAPDMQEKILFLPRTVKGRDPIRARAVHRISAVPHWNRQCKMWEALLKERMPQNQWMRESLIDKLLVIMVNYLSYGFVGTRNHIVDILLDRIMAQREQKEQAIEILIDEAVALYHLLRAVVPRIHSDANLTAAARGVLRGLDRIGPQTVPQMARERHVSRQYIQAVVNELGKMELVELVPNPAHRRSSLVRLTSKGKKLAEAVAQKEEAFLAELRIDLREKDVLLASSVLRKLRDGFVQILRDSIAGEGPK